MAGEVDRERERNKKFEEMKTTKYRTGGGRWWLMMRQTHTVMLMLQIYTFSVWIWIWTSCLDVISSSSPCHFYLYNITHIVFRIAIGCTGPTAADSLRLMAHGTQHKHQPFHPSTIYQPPVRGPHVDVEWRRYSAVVAVCEWIGIGIVECKCFKVLKNGRILNAENESKNVIWVECALSFWPTAILLMMIYCLFNRYCFQTFSTDPFGAIYRAYARRIP